MILLPISHKLGEGLAEQLLEQHLVRVVVYVGYTTLTTRYTNSLSK